MSGVIFGSGRDNMKLILLYILLSLNLYAFQEAKIVGVSQKGISFIIDKGAIEGLRAHSLGIFYFYDTSSDVETDQYIEIGPAECIKAEERRSFWLIRKPLIDLYELKNKKVQFELKDEVVKGRGPFRPLHKFSTTDGGDVHPIYLGDKRALRDRVIETEPTSDYDVVSSKKITLPEGNRYDLPSEIYKNKKVVNVDRELTPNEMRELKEQEDYSFFEEITGESVSKVNENLKKGASPQMITPYHRKRSLQNSYRKYQENKLKKASVKKEAMELIKKEGALWSASYNEKELRKFVVKSGIEEERRRQKEAWDNLASHELSIWYQSALQGDTNQVDPNHQGTSYSLGVSYEFPLIKTASFLKKWTLEGNMEQGILYTDLGEVNGRVSYGSLGVAFNWYFYHPPIAIQRYMTFLGFGMSRGNGTVSASTLGSYSMQFQKLPIYFGVKYRTSGGDHYAADGLKIGFGFYGKIGVDYNQFNSQESLDSSLGQKRASLVPNVKFGFSTYF